MIPFLQLPFGSRFSVEADTLLVYLRDKLLYTFYLDKIVLICGL